MKMDKVVEGTVLRARQNSELLSQVRETSERKRHEANLKDQGYGRFHLQQAFAVLGRFSQRAEAMIPCSSAMVDITWASGVQDI
jgi:hypothetical protein